MINYFTVVAPAYFFNSQRTQEVEFQFPTREEAEEGAIQIDKHRFSQEKFEHLRQFEDEGNLYLVKDGNVVIKEYEVKILATYKGI